MSDSLGEILIETQMGDFSSSTDPNGDGRVLTIALSEKHFSQPIVTIAAQHRIEDMSAYNFFINEVVETSPLFYSVKIGMSSPGEEAWNPNSAPIIQIHAMSYR